MSSRTYNLRARTRVGVATRSGAEQDSITMSHIPIRREPAPHLSGINPDSDSTPALRTYSDVVASRPPSPQKETSALPSGIPSGDSDDEQEPDRSLNEEAVVTQHRQKNSEFLSNFDHSHPQDREGHGWTTIRCRRVYSLSSLDRINKNNAENHTMAGRLTAEQSQVVDAATRSLTPSQRQQILCRQEKLFAQGSSESS